MALRDNPYLPLYVKDYLTDEKLSCCTLATQGVYIRILCVFHKSETYGGILYREIPDKNYSNIQFFSFIISKQIGVDFDSVFKAISELLFYNVLRIKKENGVDFLYQKRMIEDFELSEKRSKSGKKGMKKRYKICYNKNDNKTITNDITNAQQNPGSENGNGNNNNILLEGGMGETPKHCIEGEETFCEVLDELSFENVWQMYGK
jgi:hypothetical protein